MRNSREVICRLFPVVAVVVLALGVAFVPGAFFPGNESQNLIALDGDEDKKKDVPGAYKPVVEVDVVMHGVDDVFESMGENLEKKRLRSIKNEAAFLAELVGQAQAPHPQRVGAAEEVERVARGFRREQAEQGHRVEPDAEEGAAADGLV